MFLNNLIYYGFIISTSSAVICGGWLCYKFYKLNQLLNGLSKRLSNLGSRVTRESIEAFINHINEKYEPTRYYANDLI